MEYTNIHNKIKKHLDDDNKFYSLSQFRSSLFEIIDKPKSKKKPDILLYKMLMITNFKTLFAPYPPLSEKLFIFIVRAYYSKELYEKNLKSIIYKSFKINTKYFGIEEKEAAHLMSSGYVNHPTININFCSCSHNIIYHYIIENDIQERAWVGSICIINFIAKYNTEIEKTIKLLKLKVKHRKDGKNCIYCKEPLGNLQNKYAKKGYCNLFCKEKAKHRCQFCNSEIYDKKSFFCDNFCNMSYYTGFVYGKYKGEMIVDVAKKDFSYIEELNKCDHRLWEKKFGLCLHNEFDWNFVKIIKKLIE